MLDNQAAYKAAMTRKAKRSAMAAVAIFIVTALFAVGLGPFDALDKAPESRGEATAVQETGEVSAKGEKAVALETELIGYWYWGWYHFNRWETQAVANWVPWDGGSRSRFAVEVIAGPTKYSYWALMASYGLMWSYKRMAQSALSQGKCLKVAWSGISWTYRC